MEVAHSSRLVTVTGVHFTFHMSMCRISLFVSAVRFKDGDGHVRVLVCSRMKRVLLRMWKMIFFYTRGQLAPIHNSNLLAFRVLRYALAWSPLLARKTLLSFAIQGGA